MGILKQMGNIRGKVKNLLEKHPHLRDNDLPLIASIYYKEAGGKVALEQMSGMDFLTFFAEGKFTHSESIRRIRAKLQEEFPHLRGKNYSTRKKKGEDFAKEI